MTLQIIGMLVMLSVPGYFVLQYWTFRNWDGGWQVAALMPLALMVPVVLFTIGAFAAQSNLWPMVLILTSPIACLYFLGAGMVKSLR